MRVIGSGMIGRAFELCFPDVPTTFYAAGPSDSGCTDERDFVRERHRLVESLDPDRLLVYFGTAADTSTAYGQHKLQMERIVMGQPSWLILRLPIVAGRTPNPHTLLNHLYSRVARSERVTVWDGARRNIIDIADVVRVAEWLINSGARNECVNVAAPFEYSVLAMVQAMEAVTGKPAVVDLVLRNSVQTMDTERIAGIRSIFGGVDYLQRVVNKYYG